MQGNKDEIKIIGICSQKNGEYVKSMGATHFIDYEKSMGEQLKEIIGGEKGVDVWIDMIGGESLKIGMESLKSNGEIVTILPVEENK